MKLKTLVFSLCLLIQHAFGQTRSDVKVYAYARAIVGGAFPKISGPKETNHLSLVHRKEKYTYSIFIEGPLKTRIYPVEMYVKGERTGVKTAEVETPVQLKTESGPYSRPIILVPKTKNRVYRLDLSTPMAEKRLAVAKKKAAANEIVIVYKYAGRLYYAVKKKFNFLEPVVLQ